MHSIFTSIDIIAEIFQLEKSHENEIEKWSSQWFYGNKYFASWDG